MSLIGALLTVLVLQTAPPDNVNIWQGRNAEVEQCLSEAKVARLEDVPIGVTKPRRAMVEPGGGLARSPGNRSNPLTTAASGRVTNRRSPRMSSTRLSS